MNSIAFPFYGILLFNNYVQEDTSIKAIEIYTNNLNGLSSGIYIYVIFYEISINNMFYLKNYSTKFCNILPSICNSKENCYQLITNSNQING